MTENYKLNLLESAEVKTHNLTELEYEWMLFRRAEIEEQVKKWTEIKQRLDMNKKLQSAKNKHAKK